MAKDIPALSASQLGDNARPVERMREELQTLLGFRGDALDAAITYRQAIERGLIDSLGRALTGSPSYTNVYPTITGGGGSSTTPDLTPPPTPTGLTVQAGFTQVIVQWNAPTYRTRSGTTPNMQTNVYAVKKDPSDATLPTFSAGVTPRVFVAPGGLNVISLPSELNTRWHIWITFESIDEVESLVPAGGVNGYNLAGAFPTTGQDIVQLMEILTGQIRESHLYAALAEPIRSIVRRSDDAAEDALRGALATHQESRRAIAALQDEAASRGTAILQTQVLITEGDSQLAAQINLLQAVVNNPATGVAATAAALDIVETLAEDTADGVSALAIRTSTLEARVESPSATPGDPDYNPTYAALQTEQSVRAALDGAVQALYTVRTEVSSGGRTVVGGFGLAGTATASAGPRIDFGVRADTFYVEAPSGGSNPSSRLAPFIIRTSTVTENGVSIPAGVFMDAAYIVNLSAMWARFGTLIADSIAAGQISAANLTLGDGTVGGDLKSTSFSAGSGLAPGAGWKLTPGGTLYASNAVLYGTIYASAGSIGGNTIDATGIQSPGYSAGSTGWRLDTTGLVRAFASAGARVLDMAATGTQPVLKIGSALELLANGDATFAGALSAASGTFAGTLTADAINAVNTINIAGNAVTIPTSAYTGSDVSCAADTDTIVQSVTWTSTGRPTFVSVSVNVEWPGTNVLCQFTLHTGAGITIWSGYFSSYSRTGSAIVSFSTTWQAPPSGSVTLHLRARPSIMLTTNEMNLFTLEVKK